MCGRLAGGPLETGRSAGRVLGADDPAGSVPQPCLAGWRSGPGHGSEDDEVTGCGVVDGGAGSALYVRSCQVRVPYRSGGHGFWIAEEFLAIAGAEQEDEPGRLQRQPGPERSLPHPDERARPRWQLPEATTLSYCGQFDGDYPGPLRGAGDAADRAPHLCRDPGSIERAGPQVMTYGVAIDALDIVTQLRTGSRRARFPQPGWPLFTATATRTSSAATSPRSRARESSRRPTTAPSGRPAPAVHYSP